MSGILSTTLQIFIFSIVLLSANPGLAQIRPYDSEVIEANYTDEIDEVRLAEEQSFRNKETTLLSDDFFSRFTGLNYFPVDLKYRVVGTLTKLSESERFELKMSVGKSHGFMHYGKVSFFIDGDAYELQVFEFPSRGKMASAIFIPFTDMTTGEESFGGGRFVIVKIPEDEQVVIDFNRAINPICVYDPEHSCPIPPESNYMSRRITAGAKMYYDAKP